MLSSVLTVIVVLVGCGFGVMECVVLTMILLAVMKPLLLSSPSSMSFMDTDRLPVEDVRLGEGLVGGGWFVGEGL